MEESSTGDGDLQRDSAVYSDEHAASTPGWSRKCLSLLGGGRALVIWGQPRDNQRAPCVPAESLRPALKPEATWKHRLPSPSGVSLSAHRRDDGIKSHGEVCTINRRKRPGGNPISETRFLRFLSSIWKAALNSRMTPSC